jgi:hypothetical protein
MTTDKGPEGHSDEDYDAPRLDAQLIPSFPPTTS